MNNGPVLIQEKRKPNAGQRMHVPAWISDPDKPAPCICGQPMSANQRMIMGTGELGMKRWFHLSCWNMIMQDVDDDDEYWEDEEDEEEDDEDDDDWE